MQIRPSGPWGPGKSWAGTDPGPRDGVTLGGVSGLSQDIRTLISCHRKCRSYSPHANGQMHGQDLGLGRGDGGAGDLTQACTPPLSCAVSTVLAELTLGSAPLSVVCDSSPLPAYCLPSLPFRVLTKITRTLRPKSRTWTEGWLPSSAKPLTTAAPLSPQQR